ARVSWRCSSAWTCCPTAAAGAVDDSRQHVLSFRSPSRQRSGGSMGVDLTNIHVKEVDLPTVHTQIDGLPTIHTAIDGPLDINATIVSLPAIHFSIDSIPKIVIDDVNLNMRIKEFPSIRGHLPADFCVGLSVLGVELMSVRLCGEAQIITEPY